MGELVETLCFRLHIEDGERWRLKQARIDARAFANHAWAMRELEYSEGEIVDAVTPTEKSFIKNSAQAVVRKACDAYDAYQSALNTWHNSSDQSKLPKPQPPATNSLGAFPLVMHHGEGYELHVRDDDRVGYRISTQPYQEKVRGFLRGANEDLDRVKTALDSSSELAVGRAEVVYREGVYYLHVPIRQPIELDVAEDAESVIAIDINERNITTTVLDRESRDTLAQLTIDYGQVKQKRQRYYDIKRRCEEHDKHSEVRRIGSHVENFTEWTLHRLSTAIEQYVQWFPKPVVVFESLEGIRNDIEYGSYMNRRLHKLPFHEFERQVTYKAHRHGTPVAHVGSEYNSQRCACCGELGTRNSGRFMCSNNACALEQDHSDRNASVNAAVRWIAKTETGDGSHRSADNYRPRKTPPEVRVRRVGSGRHNTDSGCVDVNRPTSSHEIASQGVLHTP